MTAERTPLRVAGNVGDEEGVWCVADCETDVRCSKLKFAPHTGRELLLRCNERVSRERAKYRNHTSALVLEGCSVDCAGVQKDGAGNDRQTGRFAEDSGGFKWRF